MLSADKTLSSLWCKSGYLKQEWCDPQGSFVECADGDEQAVWGEKQEDIWIANTELAVAPGHPFYKRLTELLEGAGFDKFVEGWCARFYHARLGRPSLMLGIYFRALLVGYFEGIDSERAIAWRIADSLALRRFLRCHPS